MKDSSSEEGVAEPNKDQKIWLVVLAIPAGKVASYGLVAFAPGSETYQEQVSRLQEESVDVVNGRVSTSRFGW
jgi:methylated-DNA-protein-cysteine methyltransferase-like protein